MNERPALAFRLLADPEGRDFFGCPLWRVADADVLRYKICLLAARDFLGRAGA